MKKSTIICCIAAFALALVSCKKDPAPTPTPTPDPTPDPTPTALELKADRTSEYAGGSIIITSNKTIKDFSVKDNLEIVDYALTSEKVSDNTIKICPGSGSMKVTNSAVQSDSKITVTVTDIDGLEKTIDLTGKTWRFSATLIDEYGSYVGTSTISNGSFIYVTIKDPSGKSLIGEDGFKIEYKSEAFSVYEKETSKDCLVLMVKEISKWTLEDYTIKASYAARVVEITPKAFKYVG